MTLIQKPFKSMQFQLIFWPVLSLLLLAIVAGGYGFWYSYNEINDFQDDNLKNTSALLEQSLSINALQSNNSSDNSDLVNNNIHFDTDDDDGAITVDIIMLNMKSPNPVKDYQNKDNKKDKQDQDYSAPIPNALLTDIPSGISDQKIDGHSWRTYRDDVYIKSFSADEKVALILRQQTDLQDDLAKASALQSFLPLIIGMALLLLLLPFIMWRMMKPVRQLHYEIRQRNENDLNPLRIEHLPTELLPLAESLNRLLALVKVSIERQQRFIADAAHELRSPLTAISLQLQRLQRHAQDPLMTVGLDKLAGRLSRNQKLVEQLLTLARAGNITNHTEHTLVSVKATIEQVISLLIPIIDSKNIELTVQLLTDFSEDAEATIDETSLLILIKNLIQNAIIYSPENSQVAIQLCRFGPIAKQLTSDDVALLDSLGTHVIGLIKPERLPHQLADRLVLQIMDSGAGIDPDDYSNAFEPFVRLSQLSKAVEASSEKFAANTRSDSASNQNNAINGSGLGLSIVKSICEQAGIDLFMSTSILTDARTGRNSGLCVSLVF